MKNWLKTHDEAIRTWYRNLSQTNRIAVAGIAITVVATVVVGLLSIAVAILIAVFSKSPAPYRQEPPAGKLTGVELVDANDGSAIPLSGTNVWTLAGTNGCELAADFGSTNETKKAKTIVRAFSPTLHSDGDLALDGFSIPCQPQATNMYVVWSEKASPTSEVVNVHCPVSLDKMIRSAESDYRRMRFTNALHTAREVWDRYEGLLKEANGKSMRFDVELTAGMVKILPILIDGALADGNYDEMERLAIQYDEFCIGTTVYARAMRDIARLKREGGQLMFFSPAQLRELRKFDKDRLREYLNTLAIKGFLLPVELDASRKGYHAISYEGYFGLRGSIRYVKSVQGFGTDEKGKRLVSNRVVGQWAGMGRYVLIDVGEAAAVAMGLPDEDRVRYPLAVEVAYSVTPWCGLEPVKPVRLRRVKLEPTLAECMSEILDSAAPAESAGTGGSDAIPSASVP